MTQFTANVLGITADIEYDVSGEPYGQTHTDPAMGVEIELVGVYVDDETLEIDDLYHKRRVERQGKYEYIYESVEEYVQELCVEHWEANRG